MARSWESSADPINDEPAGGAAIADSPAVAVAAAAEPQYTRAEALTAWMPWQVGRVSIDPETEYKKSNTGHWAEDAAMCASNHVIYIPVLYPGTHIAGQPPAPPALPTVPRRNGNTLWEQFVAASKLHGINSVFIAMFDEVNEGTAIFKAVTIKGGTPNGAANFLYLNIDGYNLPYDFYLTLTGGIGKSLRAGTCLLLDCNSSIACNKTLS